MSREVRRFGQDNLAVRIPGGAQSCSVDSGVSEPEAAAFNIPRVPEYPWRIRLAESRVQNSVRPIKGAATVGSVVVLVIAVDHDDLGPVRSGLENDRCAMLDDVRAIARTRRTEPWRRFGGTHPRNSFLRVSLARLSAPPPRFRHRPVMPNRGYATRICPRISAFAHS